MTDRIAGTVLMGLDVAVEFATLGEFRLVEADAPASDDFQALPLVRRPARTNATVRDQRLLPPASTAIARAAAESAARAAERRGTRGPVAVRSALRPGAKAVLPSPPRRRAATTAGAGATAPRPVAKTPARKRGGAVEAGSQLCLFGRQ